MKAKLRRSKSSPISRLIGTDKSRKRPCSEYHWDEDCKNLKSFKVIILQESVLLMMKTANLLPVLLLFAIRRTRSAKLSSKTTKQDGRPREGSGQHIP